MQNTEQRHNSRTRVDLQALVSDRERQNTIPCTIQDASISGCKIASSKIINCPDKILINIPHMNQVVKGSIIWRQGNYAGVKFDWSAADPSEKRSGIRYEVAIPAVVSDTDQNKLIECTISDANSKGCRIINAALYTVPDTIHIEVRGLAEPVMAKVVWRDGNTAGLEFYWENEIYTLTDLAAT